jgi:dihydroorotate dehydrogenase (NAD+) catalytic subunit
MGGIATTEDVVEFLMAGASAVQIGTANFYEPTITVRLINELTEFCEKRGLDSVRSLIGSVKV